jgi:glycosyltransferase involved in cell wall biosynthesis
MAAPLCILVPCLNEAAAVAHVVEDLRATVPTARIIVIDNGSTDQTAARALAAGAEVWSEPRRGKARAILSAFERIDEPLVVVIDGDGSYPGRGIPLLLAQQERTDADMVVGIRCPDENSPGVFRPWHQTGSSAFAWTLWLVFGWKPRDIFSGLRLFKRRFYKNVPVMGEGFELEMELSVQSVEKGFLVQEVDVPFKDRHGEGTSKLRTVRDGVRILWFLLVLFRDYRPLQFFSIIASVGATLGLLAGWPPVHEYLTRGYIHRIPLAILATGFMNLALFSFLTGVLLESNLRHQREAFQLALRNFR